MHTPVFRQTIKTLEGYAKSDLDTNMSEDELVQRKIDVIDAWVALAWKVEAKESKPEPIDHSQLPNAPQLPKQKPMHASLIRDVAPALPALQVDKLPLTTLSTNLALRPPCSPSMPSIAPAPIKLPSPSPRFIIKQSSPTLQRTKDRKTPEPCILRDKPFTRISSMWKHVEGHLSMNAGHPIPCPLPICKKRGTGITRCDGLSCTYIPRAWGAPQACHHTQDRRKVEDTHALPKDHPQM